MSVGQEAEKGNNIENLLMCLDTKLDTHDVFRRCALMQQQCHYSEISKLLFLSVRQSKRKGYCTQFVDGFYE